MYRLIEDQKFNQQQFYVILWKFFEICMPFSLFTRRKTEIKHTNSGTNQSEDYLKQTQLQLIPIQYIIEIFVTNQIISSAFI